MNTSRNHPLLQITQTINSKFADFFFPAKKSLDKPIQNAFFKVISHGLHKLVPEPFPI